MPGVWPVTGSIQQQFWDAFTVPPAPQMLPGGLQDWPLVQRDEPLFSSQETP